LALWLLRAPAHGPEKIPDVVHMVGDAELFFDNGTNARAGPEGCGESMSLRPLKKVFLQFLFTGHRKFRWAAQIGPGFQSLKTFLVVAGIPEADGAAIDAQFTGNIYRTKTVFE
jgi:hypothetical protein